MGEETKTPDSLVPKAGWGAKPSLKPGDRGGLLLSKRGKDVIHFEVTRETDEESAQKHILDEGQDYSIEDKILFYKERECLLLLLEARKVLASMIAKKEALDQKLHRERRERVENEKKISGRLTVQEIQEIIQNTRDQDNFDMGSGNYHLLAVLLVRCVTEFFSHRYFYFPLRILIKQKSKNSKNNSLFLCDKITNWSEIWQNWTNVLHY